MTESNFYWPEEDDEYAAKLPETDLWPTRNGRQLTWSQTQDTEELVTDLWMSGYKEAASWMERNVYDLDSWVDSTCLMACFRWSEAPQGYDYWEEIWYHIEGKGGQQAWLENS